MLVKIEEIQGQGLERSEPISARVLNTALEDSDGFALVSSTPLVASFKKVSGRVFVKGKFSAQLKCPCKRCTAEVPVPISVDFSLRMIPEPTAPREDEVDDAAPGPNRRKRPQKKEDDGLAEVAASFELDEVDAEPFDGKTIDLDPIVREQVLLALPVTVVCRDDCKGLCSTCGQDLNEKDCGHGREKEVDVRLAKLKDIKLKN
ncbi:MAG: YceD family protein [Myxococcota bacterium]